MMALIKSWTKPFSESATRCHRALGVIDAHLVWKATNRGTASYFRVGVLQATKVSPRKLPTHPQASLSRRAGMSAFTESFGG
jgi:hypothetical protein